MTEFWNPWHGCRRVSEGCAHCYVFALDRLRGVETAIHKNASGFSKPVSRRRGGEFRYPSGTTFFTCFTSDFFLEDADEWRGDAFRIIRARPDCTFEIFTKRIDRARARLPLDWDDGYPNVRLSVSAENQRRADERVPLLLDFPAAARGIAASPLLEELHLERYLASGQIQWVSAGGESYEGARPCDFDWILSLRRQCEAVKVPFTFHQTGANFRRDGKTYLLPSHRLQLAQARRANVDYRP